LDSGVCPYSALKINLFMKKIILTLGVIIISIALINSCKKDCNCNNGSPYGAWTRLIVNTDTLQVTAEITIETDSLHFIVVSDTAGVYNTDAGVLIDGDQMFITDSDCGSTGIYKYAVDEETLALYAKEDDCAARLRSLEGIWHKK
jgi:hypothetical protein